MNHCIDVICANCGYTYCLLGCRCSTDEAEQDDSIMVEALKFVHTGGAKIFHYKHNTCRRCNSQTVFEIPAGFNNALKQIKRNKTSPAGEQVQ